MVLGIRTRHLFGIQVASKGHLQAKITARQFYSEIVTNSFLSRGLVLLHFDLFSIFPGILETFYAGGSFGLRISIAQLIFSGRSTRHIRSSITSVLHLSR